MVEQKKQVRLHVLLEPWQEQELIEFARLNTATKSAVIRQALTEFFVKHSKTIH